MDALDAPGEINETAFPQNEISPIACAEISIVSCEDRAPFDRYAQGDIKEIRGKTHNPVVALAADVGKYPDFVAQASSQLGLIGVNGTYSLVLGADEYVSFGMNRDLGDSLPEHVSFMVDRNSGQPSVTSGIPLSGGTISPEIMCLSCHY